MEDDYLNALQLIRFEIFKGNIEVCALVCREQDKYCSIKDGFRVLTHDEISKSLNSDSQDYPDFIVVCNLKEFEKVKDFIVSRYNYPRTHILSSAIFFIKCFDFSLYANLIYNPVSIVSNSCFGGYIYKYLMLQYSSPFIWFLIKRDDYLKLCDNLDGFLSNPFCFKKDINLRTCCDGYAELVYKSQSIELMLFHYVSFEDAKEKFERRLSRFNHNNLLYLFTANEINTSEDFICKVQARFKVLNEKGIKTVTAIYDNKLNNNIYSERFPSHWRSNFPNRWWQYIHTNFFRHIDCLRMLNGHDDFLRETI